MTRAVLFVIVLTALGSPGARPIEAQARDAAAPRPSPSASTSRVSGRVIESSDQRQPVRRAIVTITGGALAAGRSAITDEEGRFAFDAVPAGEFTLTSRRPGYLPAAYGATRPGRPGTPIAVRDGTPVEVVLPMTRGSAIEGLLRDVTGDPAPGMRVQAIRIVTMSTGARGEAAGVAMTDDRGVFRIFGLPAGDYVLAATPATIVSGIGDIGAPSEADVDARLAALRRRSVGPAPPQRPGTPAAPPNAAIPALRGHAMPAVYYPGVLQSGEATRITLGANDERVGLDFATRLSHAATIEGQLVPVRGQEIPLVQISILGGGPVLPVAGGAMAAGPSVSVRAAERTFRITNVPPGKYRIHARTFNAPGSQTQGIASAGATPSIDPSAGVQWAAVDVEIGNDDLSGVTLALQPAPRVTGRITFDATTLRAPANASAIRIALDPIADADRGSNGLSGTIIGTPRADGAFEFPAVIPGTYRLSATATGGWWARSALVEGRDVLDGVLVVGATGAQGLGLLMSDRPGSISGRLSGTGGRPAPEHYMVVLPADRSLWRAPSRRIRSTRPASDGAFELRELPPGAYLLAALTDMDPTDLEDPVFLETLATAAVAVTVGEGERKVQDLRISGGGTPRTSQSRPAPRGPRP